jgi:hypothetical protein
MQKTVRRIVVRVAAVALAAASLGVAPTIATAHRVTTPSVSHSVEHDDTDGASVVTSAALRGGAW